MVYGIGILVDDTVTNNQFKTFLDTRVAGLVEGREPTVDGPKTTYEYYVLAGTETRVVLCAAISGGVQQAVKATVKDAAYGMPYLLFDQTYDSAYIRARLEQFTKEQPINVYRIITPQDPAGSDVNPAWLPVV
jgi:hypothetical protein